jgi:outer membrane biosynthesis protein TonB
VTLAVAVTASGHAGTIEIVRTSGDKAIDDAVAHAAQHSTYSPEIRNCKAVSGGTYLFHVEVGPS